ncbi:DUF4202 domain-containing protein [Geojedonia litorea]|uniref:DUF4202 domain-containing protein n=1 Tax=Geojedonia litorea TaxID=1268269 RepID=A0ABV9N188_9FLAO
MEPNKFECAIALIDKKNSEDINLYHRFGVKFSKEVLYSMRMSQRLLQFHPNASEALRVAAHAQHICRWKIPREDYSMDKIGYIKWREVLKNMHAALISEILKEVGYDHEFIDRVSFLIQKKMIKKDKESQILEDVICLVFLDYYFEEFAAKHEEEKVVDILRKTWQKMSEKGHEVALKLNYTTKTLSLIKKAIK